MTAEPKGLLTRAVRRIQRDGPRQGVRALREALLQGPRKAAARRWLEQHLATIPNNKAFFSSVGMPEPRTQAELRRSVASLDATLRRRFLPSLSDPGTGRQISETLPESAAATIARAEDVLAGRLSWLVPGYPDGAQPPRWHTALGPEDWPLAPVWELDITSEERKGDVRQTWELSRHQYLSTLARAHLLTGEERYAAAIGEHLADWIARNPVGVGVNWLHAQEAALRIKSWLFALAATSRSSAIDVERRLLLYKILTLHGELVARTLSLGANTHNHLITEVCGLLELSVAMPSLRRAEQFRSVAGSLLQAEVQRQFFDEGSPGEGATSYHLFVLESVLEVLALRRRAVLHLTERVRARVLAMLDFARRILRPDGTLPLIGDADSGRGFRLTELNEQDRRGVLAIGALLFRRGDIAAGLDALPEPAAWLLGAGAFRDWDRLPRDDDPPTGRLFQSAGIAIIRSKGRAAPPMHVVVTGGPTVRRTGVLDAHHHADSLSLVVWAGGRELLVDPGVFLYGGLDPLRAAFRATSAHSTLQVDEQDRFDVTSLRFGIAGLRTSRLAQWDAGPQHRSVAFTVPAGASGPAAEVLLQRQVLIRPERGYLLLCDSFLGEGVHTVRTWFQAGALVARPEESGVVLVDETAATVGVIARLTGGGELAIKRGEGPEPGLGLVAPRYGQLEPGTTLSFTVSGARLPHTAVTWLATAHAAAFGRPAIRVEGARTWVDVPLGGDAVDRIRVEGGMAVLENPPVT